MLKGPEYTGIYTDYWGNAVVPYLTNYRRNTVTVNSGERDDLDIEKPAKDVVRRAVVAANFSAAGYSRLINTSPWIEFCAFRRGTVN